MMDNAQWRDDQRAKNVARYEEEQKKEEEDYARNAGKNDDFIAWVILVSGLSGTIYCWTAVSAAIVFTVR